MASRQRPSTDSAMSDDSTTSQSSIPYSWSGAKSKFKAKDLLPHLNDIALHIDFPAVALGWCSSGVIEIHQAQELLRFNGDEVDKNLKVLDVFNQLRRQESRVPLFLRELLKSGESSPTNRDLYGMLSEKMIFNDYEVENACERKWNGGTKLPRQVHNASSSSLTSSGIESSKEQHERKYSTPAMPLRPRRIVSQEPATDTYPSPKSPVDKPGLLQKYNLMKEENIQLHKMLVETQSKLIDVQQQLIIMQNEQQIQQLKVSVNGQDRKKSQHSLAAVAERQRKLSRSLDSLHHAIIKQQMDN